MQARITLLTLGGDLERAVALDCDGLGFAAKGSIGAEFEKGAVAFFNLQAGLKLAPFTMMSAVACLPYSHAWIAESRRGDNSCSASIPVRQE